MFINTLINSCRAISFALMASGALIVASSSVSVAGGPDDTLHALDYIDLTHPDGTEITKTYRLFRYRTDFQQQCEVTTTTTYTTDSETGYKKMVAVNQWATPCPNVTFTDETIYVPREGFFWTKSDNLAFDPPLLIMPDKFSTGDTWGGSSTLKNGEYPIGLHIGTRSAIGIEDLTIQDDGGTERSYRNCLKARHDRTSQGVSTPGMTRIRWYCPGTGWVKEDRINAYRFNHDINLNNTLFMEGRTQILNP